MGARLERCYTDFSARIHVEGEQLRCVPIPPEATLLDLIVYRGRRDEIVTVLYSPAEITVLYESVAVF